MTGVISHGFTESQFEIADALKTGNALIVPLVLRVSMASGNPLPSGDTNARLLPITLKNNGRPSENIIVFIYVMYFSFSIHCKYNFL